jgi:hypothetical protein
MSNIFLLQVLHFVRSSADPMHKFSKLCIEQSFLSPTLRRVYLYYIKIKLFCFCNIVVYYNMALKKLLNKLHK